MDCGIDQLFCKDELTVDWFVYGTQVAIIQRGCSATEAKPDCTPTINGASYAMTDCQHSCTADDKKGCNNDMSVADKIKARV